MTERKFMLDNKIIKEKIERYKKNLVLNLQ